MTAGIHAGVAHVGFAIVAGDIVAAVADNAVVAAVEIAFVEADIAAAWPVATSALVMLLRKGKWGYSVCLWTASPGSGPAVRQFYSSAYPCHSAVHPDVGPPLQGASKLLVGR